MGFDTIAAGFDTIARRSALGLWKFGFGKDRLYISQKQATENLEHAQHPCKQGAAGSHRFAHSAGPVCYLVAQVGTQRVPR